VILFYFILVNQMCCSGASTLQMAILGSTVQKLDRSSKINLTILRQLLRLCVQNLFLNICCIRPKSYKYFKHLKLCGNISHTHTHTHTHRERERERKTQTHIHTQTHTQHAHTHYKEHENSVLE
jgi:sRNA-binding protein